MTCKRKALYIDEKVSLIQAIQKGEKITDVGRRLGFSPSTVSTIWKNKDKILQAKVNGYASKKIKRPKYESLDREMALWYNIQCENNVKVSGSIIKAKAEEIAKQLGITEFKASEGWLGKFKKRHHIHNYDTNTTLTMLCEAKIQVKSEDLSQSEAEENVSGSEKETEHNVPSESNALLTSFLHNSQQVVPRPKLLQTNYGTLASIWIEKLERLHPVQKLFAEKAINDILFEAELGNLNRNSVRINEPPVTESTARIAPANISSSSHIESTQQ